MSDEDFKATQPNATELEVTKVIFANSFEFLRSTAQVIQALTGLLLTAYIALLVGFCRDHGLHGACQLLAAFAPIALFSASLAIALIQAITYKGTKFVMDESTGIPLKPFDTYDTIISERRHQLVWPSFLTGAGVLMLIVSFFIVLIPSATAPVLH